MLQSGIGFRNIILKGYPYKEREFELIVDETVIKVGSSDFVWLWVAIEPKNSEILALTISKERNMFVAERFLSGLVSIIWKASYSFHRWRYLVSPSL
jgi:hypothetical protein